jgi:glycosyltransferase involved in cell wall biosynthesis
LRIAREFPQHTSFGILAADFNKRLADIRPDLSVHIALPTGKAANPDKEIFWLFWETSKLPTYSHKLLKTYRHVWTPSAWLTGILLKEGIESRVVRLVLDPNEWNPSQRTHSTFRFLWVNEWIHRKGGDLLIEAFLQSFKSQDDVELVIKPNYTNQDCPVRFPSVECVISSVSGGPKDKIKIIDEYLPQKSLAELYASCDCYVYPFRTQGASLTLLEAQACGLPAITTAYAGCLDYAVEDCTYFIEPVGFKPVTKIDFFAAYGDQDLGVEAVPNSRQLRELLRYCFEHPAEARAKGLRASETVRKDFSWESMRRDVSSALESEPRRRLTRFWR